MFSRFQFRVVMSTMHCA